MCKKTVSCINCKKEFKVRFFFWLINRLKHVSSSSYVCDKCHEKWLKEREELLKENNLKIEIELDQDKKLELDIISKAFGISPGEFIDFVLKKELDYVKYLFELTHPKEELEDYYERKINLDELKKLILVEEVL